MTSTSLTHTAPAWPLDQTDLPEPGLPRLVAPTALQIDTEQPTDLPADLPLLDPHQGTDPQHGKLVLTLLLWAATRCQANRTSNLLLSPEDCSQRLLALRQRNCQLEQRVLDLTEVCQRTTERLSQSTNLHDKVKLALETSETRFRSLVEQTSDWIWEMNPQCQFTYVSPRVIEIIGHEPKALVGRQLIDFMVEDEAVRFSTLLYHATQQQQPFSNLEATCRHANGRAVALEISGSPYFNSDGQIQGYRGLIHDITDRKLIERDIRKALTKEKELNELKTRFISMASHEFRTPLTTILASAETLERYRHKFSEEKQITILQRIQSSVNHLMSLLNDMLTVGKAETQNLDFQPESLDLKKLCQDIIDELRWGQQSPAAKIELQWSGETSTVLADEKLLRHMVTNLVSNAIKYSPDGTPITVQVACAQPQTRIDVIDQGIGIAIADQARLFEAFYRGNNVNNISGTGLGLAIAKRAAERHQGNLTFTSQPGVGTTFTLHLPLTFLN